MISGRALDKLGAEGDALTALQTIVTLFGEPYLTVKADNKPISLLWNRPDRLATVELYIFGKCLQKVMTSNEKWLKQTIREIKKSPEKARGLCTEIIYLGMFDVQERTINPAAKNNAGYDFSITTDDGQNQYVSIKNVDISANNASFQRGCRKVRTRWQDKLRLNRKNLSLRVIIRDLPAEEDFDLIIKSIQEQKEIYPKLHLTPKAGIDIFIASLPSFGNLSSAHTSDAVMFYCTAPTSETQRYLSGVRKAVQNIYRHTKNDISALRVVFMRLHVNADFDEIRKQAKELVNLESNEVDCLIFHQPSYVRDEQNNSHINHGFLIEANARFALASTQYGLIKCMPPIGSVSLQQSRNQIRDVNNGSILDVHPSDYLFQQGDIYNLGKMGEHISLSSPATGIREHGVCLVDGSHIVFSSKITPPTEDLLLI